MKAAFATWVIISSVVIGLAAEVQRRSTNEMTAETNLVHEFERRVRLLDFEPKMRAAQRLNLLQEILDEAGASVREKELARLSSQPVHTEFEKLMAEAFVQRLNKAGDLKALENLLARNCPDYVATTPLEYFLARSRGPSAIFTLTHAYGKAGTNASGNVILQCLKRAFPALKNEAGTDKALVAACESWITANLSRCIINYEYPHMPSAPPTGPGPPIPLERLALFVVKD